MYCVIEINKLSGCKIVSFGKTSKSAARDAATVAFDDSDVMIDEIMSNNSDIYHLYECSDLFYMLMKNDSNMHDYEICNDTKTIKLVLEDEFYSLYRAVTDLSGEIIPGDNVYKIISGLVDLAIVKESLEITGNNQSKAAKHLGINRGTFRKKVERAGL